MDGCLVEIIYWLVAAAIGNVADEGWTLMSLGRLIVVLTGVTALVCGWWWYFSQPAPPEIHTVFWGALACTVLGVGIILWAWWHGDYPA